MNVIVLAGGPPDDVSALQPGAPNKAYVSIAGKTLLQRTLEALRAAHGVERIVVVTPRSAWHVRELSLADEIRPDGAKIRASLESGLTGFDPDTPVLVATSDLPVLTPEAVDDFIGRVVEKNADVLYGCVSREAHIARYPQIPHTWVRLSDGVFCGSGLMALKPGAFPALSLFIERLGAARKNPLRLASLFGRRILLRFALRRLSIAQAETRATEVLGRPVRAVVSPFAETAVNVDRVSDVALAEALVSSSA